MRLIFAHGPWYMEWHHLFEYVPLIGPPIMAWLAVRMTRKGKK